MTVTADHGFDVAIIGLGPVGCLGAILFAEAGLNVVAIERDRGVYTLPRAVSLDGEIIRALQPAGLAEAVNQMMQPLREDERAGFANSKREWLFGGTLASMGSNGWQPANMFDQPELETFLRAHAQSHPRVTTHIGYEVTEFETHPEQVSLHATGSRGDLALSAKYLIACDGASSSIRKTLGIHWRDLGYDQDWLVVDVEMQLPHDLPNEVLQICDPKRIHTYVATKDPYRRWEFQLNPGETAKEMLETQTIYAFLDSWTPRDTYRIRRAAVYQFHAAVASSWQQGRVFLAGDAAHQTPPFLGQGMNSGMRDVINLAWKLPLILRGVCDQSLLETYQAERDAHAHDLVLWAVELGYLMQNLADQEAAAAAGEAAPTVRKTVRKSGYGQGREQPPIRSGAVMVSQVSDEGATGYLLAQPLVRDAAGKVFRFDDLLGPHFGLITNGPISLSPASQAVMEMLEIRQIDISGLKVERGKFPEPALQGECVLVRPDRLIFGQTNSTTSLHALLAALADAVGLISLH